MYWSRLVGIRGSLVSVGMCLVFSHQALGQSYSDVATSFWAYEEIDSLEQAGFNIRCAETPRRFCPTEGLQNASMAAWLSKASNGTDYWPPTGSGNRFTDMPASHWAVSWAEDVDRKRIYRGCEDQSRFCPTRILTRAQFAITSRPLHVVCSPMFLLGTGLPLTLNSLSAMVLCGGVEVEAISFARPIF